MFYWTYEHKKDAYNKSIATRIYKWDIQRMGMRFCRICNHICLLDIIYAIPQPQLYQYLRFRTVESSRTKHRSGIIQPFLLQQKHFHNKTIGELHHYNDFDSAFDWRREPQHQPHPENYSELPIKSVND